MFSVDRGCADWALVDTFRLAHRAAPGEDEDGTALIECTVPGQSLCPGRPGASRRDFGGTGACGCWPSGIWDLWLDLLPL